MEARGWCVVATVTDTGAEEVAPGTLVWVLPPKWGDGGQDVLVAGRHRRSPGPLSQLLVPRVHLAEFGVREVRDPAVRRQLTKKWQGSVPRQWESREEAEKVAGWWARDAAVQAGVRRPWERIDFYHRLGAVRPGHVLQQWAVRDIMSPRLSFELGDVFRDQREVDAVRELRALIGTRNNELWPVVGTTAEKIQALLSR
ncbi:hypothetical protein [Lentzea sp. NPDC059081]|uniref:hypothetical protein n=1 Tax=Lentzea sp. NPDC059081 TaxID=3346719 RepID=UPI0036C989FB